MLSANQIHKSYSDNVILDAVSFNLNPGHRLGLIGPNGCGKTTLLRILAGKENPDSGTVRKPNGLRIGYLTQGLELPASETIGGYLDRAQGGLAELADDVERLAAELALAMRSPPVFWGGDRVAPALAERGPEDRVILAAYDDALARLAAVSQNGGAGQTAGALANLGLDQFPADTSVSYLSGGQKTRLALGGVLLSRPQLLLLDEPTNHLDIQMLEWLEEWLASFRGGALIVSHDRAFLDRTVNRILELDIHTHTTREYAGNYSAYWEEKMAERERQWQSYTDQRQEIAELSSAARRLRGIARFKKGGKADTNDGFARGFFANRGAGTVQRAKNIERRIERLTGEDRIDKPRQDWQMKLEFDPAGTSGNDVLSLDDLAVGYGENILLRNLTLRIRRGARVVLTGANGSGKTTLLRTVAGTIPPLGGRLRVGAGVRLGFMAQEQETLDPARNALEIVRAEVASDETDARRFLHYFLFSGDDVFVPAGSLSYGERARLLLALLVARGCNFLLLDEPVNHLDIPSRSCFEQALTAFEGTALVVLHDRYFIEHFATEVWNVDTGSVRKLD